MTIKASSYPTSRPTLDLNFAQTKRLDPRVTFTRSSTGTYFDANGVLQSAATNTARFDHNPSTGESLGLLVEEARTNLQTYSERLDDTSWTKDAATVVPESIAAPNGTLTGDKLVETATTGAHRAYYGATTVANTSAYTSSVYAKAGERAWISISGISVSSGRAWFNLATGVVGTVQAGLTASIQSVGNGWYRCSVTQTTFNTSGYLDVAIASADNTYSYAGTLGNGVYLWGAQLEAGSFPTSYIPTPATFTSRASSATFYDASGVIQTAGTNVARSAAFFPDSNGVMRSAGLLLEAAGTNLALHSEALGSWTNNGNGIAITSNVEVAPDGTTTADRLAQSATTGATRALYNLGTSVRSGQTFTTSFWMKRVSGTDAQPTFIVNGIGGGPGQAFTVTTSWKRYSFTWTAINDGGTYEVGSLYFSWDINGAANNNVYSIWGFQVEQNSYATSYIPTTTATVTRSADVSSSATVTRSADVAQITGTNFSSWYNQSEGTLFAQGSARGSTENGGTNSFLANLAVTSSHVFADLLDNGSSFRMSVFNGTTNPYSATPSTSGAGYGSTRKAALAMKPGNYGSSLNGVAQAGGASSLPIPAFDRLNIGYYAFYNYMRINSTISRLTYWPIRLSDATLQAITL